MKKYAMGSILGALVGARCGSNAGIYGAEAHARGSGQRTQDGGWRGYRYQRLHSRWVTRRPAWHEWRTGRRPANVTR